MIDSPMMVEAGAPTATQRGYLVKSDWGGQAQGTGGYLLWTPGWKLLQACGRWYGRSQPTNNHSKVAALINTLVCLLEVGGTNLTTAIVVGDSQLIIWLCAGLAYPK